MPISCAEKIDCPGSDFPITNYSAEGPENPPPFCSVVFPTGWDKGGCMTVCCLPESQNAADVCAIGQEAACPPKDPCLFPPCPPRLIFCSTAQTCSCVFANGAEFFYTTPAGTFCAETQAAADALAHSYACEHCGRSNSGSTQLGELDACACLGAAYSDAINFTGAAPLAWLVISGSLPPGLTLNSITGRVSGTPTTNGTYTFTVRTFSPGGVNYGQKTYSVSVLEITTTALTAYTLGTAYSFQMQAAGGSGNYAWRISVGSLPAGLAMSATGLISGTPTAVGSFAIQFQIIDLTCEAANKTYFTPLVSTSSVGNTQLRTRIGFPEFVPSAGTLYKRVTYSGFHTQVAYPYGQNPPGTNEIQAAGAKYTYGGYDLIDIYGNIITRHTKLLSVMCNQGDPGVTAYAFNSDGSFYYVPYPPVLSLLGYCWTNDPTSCAVCDTDELTWTQAGDRAWFGSADYPFNMVPSEGPNAGNPTRVYTVTPTSIATDGIQQSGPKILKPFPPGFPVNVGEQATFTPAQALIEMISNGVWNITLSDPFTDAEAVAAQTSYGSNSRSSENIPNYRSWAAGSLQYRQGKFTSSNFLITCSNLVAEESYTVRWEYWDSNGTMTPDSETFTAVGETHLIQRSVPTPAAGRTITLRNVRITYA